MRARQNTKRRGLGRRLLRVAILADTHLSEADGVSNSPFAVNRLANERFRHVVECVNTLKPDLCVHLGDLTHPVPAAPALFESAVKCFREQIARIGCECILVPGNHDVGDKPIDWGPAGVIKEEYIDLWRARFGPDYRATTVSGCHFVALNAQLFNTGFAGEREQDEWLNAYLRDRRGGRFFFCLHYPPYLDTPDEREHYDNIAEPARGRLLRLLEDHRAEALFAGHVHHFWFYRHARTDCYLLPSTAFARQDYSETLVAAPTAADEYGRNDTPKLGFALLEVYENGHLCRLVRTQGRRIAANARGHAMFTRPRSLRLPFPPHPRQHLAPTLGFDMRKDWLSSVAIPPAGGLDEFDRKTARNDYPLLALWEMGVNHIRIPRADVDTPSRVKRLRDLKCQGMRYTLFTYGVPDNALVAQVRGVDGLLDAWEIAAPLEHVDIIRERLTGAGLPPVYFSKLHTKRDSTKSSGVYYHVINHGFSATEDLPPSDLSHDIFAGCVFRVGRGLNLPQTAAATDQWARRQGKQASLHVRLGGENPAQATQDAQWTCRRVIEAAVCAHVFPGARVFIDTLADVDRGYFPRLGVIDALHNPRDGHHAIRNLNAALQGDHAWALTLPAYNDHGLIHLRRGDDKACVLIVPPGKGGVHLSDIGQDPAAPTECRDLIEGKPRRDATVNAKGELATNRGGRPWLIRFG